MDQPNGVFNNHADATRAVTDAAEVLARRIGLGPDYQDDLEQELWLYLLLWRDERTKHHGDEQLAAHDQDVSSRVRRLVNVLAPSTLLSRRLGLDQPPTAPWLASGVAAKRFEDAQRLCDLRFDLRVALRRLPVGLRSQCQRRLDDATTNADTASVEPLAVDTATSLRRVFHAHDLHEYL